MKVFLGEQCKCATILAILTIWTNCHHAELDNHVFQFVHALYMCLLHTGLYLMVSMQVK